MKTYDFQVMAKNDQEEMVCAIYVMAETKEQAMLSGYNSIQAMLREGVEIEPYHMDEVDDQRCSLDNIDVPTIFYVVVGFNVARFLKRGGG